MVVDGLGLGLGGRDRVCYIIRHHYLIATSNFTVHGYEALRDLSSP